MLPVVGITMGDAAGVGPEIIVKALGDPQLHETCRPLVIGDAKMLERAKAQLGSDLHIAAISEAEEARYEPNTINCLDLDLLPADLPLGQISPAAGDAAFRYIKKAVELAEQGLIQAICTAPLNKEALQKGGHKYPGHTEILADLTNSADVFMMLTAPGLRVIHVTTHVGLIDAVRKITPDRVYKVIRAAYDTLRRAGISAPKIAVCGINPHAGENGLFGNGEEEEKIVPAVGKARAEGIDAVGPLPADTLFFRARRGDFDIVVAMYHDQGHGPIKVLGLEAGVNISIGLPIIRTSVDHGTAFDIAGKGIADELSLKEAVRQAVELAPRN
ncbi:4-hydroxythreonine-4-phosphate dehydrogenase PdxA [Paenibacillus thalictri]|uniref:4-hydroxythreonine-4-phosphate dehydrogenase PdxA n=1 Tax=Paenibacillus thalictri TaxID=2527873 RepID=A0A4V2J4F2_9BACL|nr:4-hydroxythreonine-4-phosphate dehydrogenase PdxA [Paenibacillus thalictri]TBL79592.1 4-hydroxythreonine-4-phosphate dehydrogenase PdxA [Paenibacillus thalictri]